MFIHEVWGESVKMALCFVGRSAKFSGTVSTLVGCKGRAAAGRDTALKCPDTRTRLSITVNWPWLWEREFDVFWDYSFLVYSFSICIWVCVRAHVRAYVYLYMWCAHMWADVFACLCLGRWRPKGDTGNHPPFLFSTLFSDVGSLTQTQNFLIWLPSGDSLHSEDGVNRPGFHGYLIFT